MLKTLRKRRASLGLRILARHPGFIGTGCFPVLESVTESVKYAWLVRYSDELIPAFWTEVLHSLPDHASVKTLRVISQLAYNRCGCITIHGKRTRLRSSCALNIDVERIFLDLRSGHEYLGFFRRIYGLC